MAKQNLLVQENATGLMYVLRCEREDVYRIFGREILDMEDTDDPNFDESNVDISVAELPRFGPRPLPVEFPEDTATQVLRKG